MVVRIVIAGESQCEVFAEVCMVADYLSQNLPCFCWSRIEKPVIEWKAWLFKINLKNKWHHAGSPVIWKEMLMEGSKPLYIGGVPDFLEYCHSYYKFDAYIAPGIIDGLTSNFAQYQNRIVLDTEKTNENIAKAEVLGAVKQINFVICISGAGNPLTMHLISGLLDMSIGEKSISKIYLYDDDCSHDFMNFVERECSFVDTDYAGKVVKFIDKIGVALTHTDLLIVLNHVPFEVNLTMGDWLHANHKAMRRLSLMINATASRKMFILFPNLGPACYNATALSELININKNNVVVATSDLGLEVSTTLAEIAKVPSKDIFCPPVWGFVGINHLVDILNTIHRYDSFVPYNRYTKVRNSSLIIGNLTPELRTMEYLMYFDKSLWTKVAENKTKMSKKQEGYNKALAVLDVVKLWLFERDPKHIVSLGIRCNGSFGLTFKGKFSQPARFVDEHWEPAEDFLTPKEPQIKLSYLQEMAEFTMKIRKGELPNIVPYWPCSCKQRVYKKK